MTDEPANQTEPAVDAQPDEEGSWPGVFDMIEGLFSILTIFF